MEQLFENTHTLSYVLEIPGNSKYGCNQNPVYSIQLSQDTEYIDVLQIMENGQILRTTFLPNENVTLRSNVPISIENNIILL